MPFPVRRLLVCSFAIVVLGVVLNACAGAQGNGEVFDRTVFSYHQHLRWKRYDKAANFMTEKNRKAFLAVFGEDEEALSIDNLEVKDIAFEDSNKRAKVTVSVQYFKLPSVTLQKHKWVQRWRRQGNDWWLESDPKDVFFPDAASLPTEPTPPPTKDKK